VIYNDSNFFYNIVRNGDQTTVKYNFGNNGGSDTLDGVERLLFNYSAIALDIDGHGGQAYRLYQAAFGRTPDKAARLLDQGARQGQQPGARGRRVRQQRRVPQPQRRRRQRRCHLCQLLYNNVLHRAPDIGGQQYWFDALHNGATRADLLILQREAQKTRPR
jgi:hypothetical protein